MVINHLEKLIVTSDASTIINELEVEHPAAKLLVFAAQAQQQEIGDGTNFVRSRFPPSDHTSLPLPGCQHQDCSRSTRFIDIQSSVVLQAAVVQIYTGITVCR